ncbi:unnamed protein product [Adineta steineri]|uniref:GIY-YIG domain-containing protein n=1 Tax=Adineta steineri TaxID=433720 RepID=A0A815UM81_9BILA|nr:unnamed protein product [Adineta steineri]CAF4143759.1 unnamed protein product [Adineta steineri]
MRQLSPLQPIHLAGNDDVSLQQQPHPTIITTNFDQRHCRLHSLLPAYPPPSPSLSFEQNPVINQDNHLLRPHVPFYLLTQSEYQQRRRFAYRSSFILIDQRMQDSNSNIPSFLLNKYQQWYTDLSRHLNVDIAILDYNYIRLFQCLEIMKNERLYCRFQTRSMEMAEQLPVDEYAIALEFYLQIDKALFYMKTCSYRGARLPALDLFSTHAPVALYGLLRCNKSYCRFCFPTRTMRRRAQYYVQPVLQFSPTHEHRFNSGYITILNCPFTCQTKNIIYALTCPCKQFDYIGYTSISLGERLKYHREHGNRIIHEFILGPENIRRVQQQPKSHETLVKDGMLLYKHSARCSHAIQLFLDCNPQYWPLIPMTKEEAQIENQSYHLPPDESLDLSSHCGTSIHTRSDHASGSCMIALPSFPSDQYIFSLRQCAEQYQFFKNKQDLRTPNFDLDLYDASIIAVLPDSCSITLKRLIESLLITHAQTKLNTLGHLDGYDVLNSTQQHHPLNCNYHWCQNLVRRH